MTKRPDATFFAFFMQYGKHYVNRRGHDELSVHPSVPRLLLHLLLCIMLIWKALTTEAPEAYLPYIIDDNAKETDRNLCHLL